MPDLFNKRIARNLIATYGREVVEIFRVELARVGLPEKYPSGVDIELHNSVSFVVNDKFELIINMLPHWFWVVKGRRPKSLKGKHRGPKNPVKPDQEPPPFSEILKWVAQKRKFQFRDNKGRFLSFNQTAWIIRAAILKNGIKPRNFVTPAVNEAQRRWVQSTASEIVQDFIQVAGVDFQRQRIRKSKNIKLVK